jgi:N-acetylglucosaminyl-diphospho-decaprenol L-rhamnosyltransferase
LRRPYLGLPTADSLLASPGVTGRVPLSVVVVTYDSGAALGSSLPPLLAQLGASDELIVVDNASADDTVARVRRLAPHARLLVQERNLGFAAGCNAGAAVAGGELLVFLNPDAVVADGFAEAIRRPLDRGWDAWMGVVTAGDVLNTTGGVVHFTGIAWSGQVGEPVTAAPAGPREVAFASGACLAVPRGRWAALGGFAPEFFMYCEDVDLSLRAWLWGGRVGVEPAARVDHDYSFAKGDYKWRLLERNRAAMVIRTYPGPLLALLAPALLATELALLAIAPASGWGWPKLRAHADTLRALPRLLRERRAIQARRTIGAREFARLLTPELSSPDLGRVARNPLLRTGLRGYWAAVRAALSVIR